MEQQLDSWFNSEHLLWEDWESQGEAIAGSVISDASDEEQMDLDWQPCASPELMLTTAESALLELDVPNEGTRSVTQGRNLAAIALEHGFTEKGSSAKSVGLFGLG